MSIVRKIFLLILMILSENLLSASENLSDVPCGRPGSSTSREGRIVGGENARPGEFPWLVSITRRGGHFCGGTLINRQWVMTAAHCMCSGHRELSVESMRIIVGEHDLTSASEVPAALEHRVEHLVMHPGFRCSRGSFTNDLALLRLAGPGVTWSSTVQPACLPKNNQPLNALNERRATAAGWGWMAENTAIIEHSPNSATPQPSGRASVLQKVDLEVVSNDKCREWYRSEGKKTQIMDSQMCAGFEFGGRDACWADSGGPLMIGEEDHVTVVGVISTGIGCARPRLPGLYTRLSDYVNWIQTYIQPQQHQRF